MMTVDLLPETMRFVSLGQDGRFQLEFIFEVTCGLARFTLPVTVGGQSSIDEALAQATCEVRALGLALARAAREAAWLQREQPAAVHAFAGPARQAARVLASPLTLEQHKGAMILAVAETPAVPATPSQCCDAI